jgi:hypothetical protein
MSHTVELAARMKDPAILAECCKALGLGEPVAGKHRLFDGRTVEGLAVRLPGWAFPAIIDAEGRVLFDTYKGAWGDIRELHKLSQRYSVKATVRQAKRHGWRAIETAQPDGSVVVEVIA